MLYVGVYELLELVVLEVELLVVGTYEALVDLVLLFLDCTAALDAPLFETLVLELLVAAALLELASLFMAVALLLLPLYLLLVNVDLGVLLAV